MKLLLILAAVIILAIAQSPCESPPLWQGKVIEVMREEHSNVRVCYLSFVHSSTHLRPSQGGPTFSTTKLTHGSPFTTDVSYQGRETYTFDLFFYAKAKYYSLNLQTQACTIGPLNGSFPVIGVPPGSNLTGQFYIGVTGVPNDYVLVNRYEDYNGNYLGSWTNAGCAPVAAFVNTTKYGNIFFNFFDIQLGLDPNVFSIPKQCA
eukprot:Em0019g263a